MQRSWKVQVLMCFSPHRERELTADIARLKAQLVEQKAATQKTVLVGSLMLRCVETLHSVMTATCAML